MDRRPVTCGAGDQMGDQEEAMTDSLVTRIRTDHTTAWERVVTHPFVLEMGDGTLPLDKFRFYFVQDYIFVKELVAMMGLAIRACSSSSSACRRRSSS